MNPVYRFFATINSFAPTILRLYLALIFTAHGGQKTIGWLDGAGWHATMAQITAPQGMHLPYAIGALGLLAVAVAAFCLWLGLFTRLAAFLVLTIMAVLINSAKWEQGYLLSPEFEYPFTLLVVALSLLFCGGGKFSLDRAITRQLLPPNTGFIG